jgi:hypothetical protein
LYQFSEISFLGAAVFITAVDLFCGGEVIFLSDVGLEEKARELKREYEREWRRKNPEKVKQYNRNRWLKKAKQQLDSMTEE